MKKYRATHHLTQKQLADKLQVSLRLVENWEEGINKPAAFLKRALDNIEKCEK